MVLTLIILKWRVLNKVIDANLRPPLEGSLQVVSLLRTHYHSHEVEWACRSLMLHRLAYAPEVNSTSELSSLHALESKSWGLIGSQGC